MTDARGRFGVCGGDGAGASRASLAERMTEQGKAKGKRTGKDTVFTHLFSEPEYRFQLFQALHPEITGLTADDIIPLTINNVLLDKPYNDLGLLAGNKLLILVEAQSTWSINILIRFLLYLAQTYLNYINAQELNLYGVSALPLPEPEFYVIYTGDRKDRPERLNFREEFFGGKEIAVDIEAKVIYGEGRGDIVSQYVAFCHVLDEQYRKFGRTAEAVREAIRICKDRDVLRKYLEEREREVVDIMLALFDQETALKNYVAASVREARVEQDLVRIKGLIETTNWSPEEAMNALKIPADQQAIYATQL